MLVIALNICMKIRALHLNLVSDVSAVALILMWMYAAMSKLFSFENFRLELLGHNLIRNHASLIALNIPIAELLIVLLLVFTRTQRIGHYASAGLLAVFTGYIIYMFQFYPHAPCSCGGGISSLSWKEHIAFNLSFMGVSVIGLLSGPSSVKFSASV